MATKNDRNQISIIILNFNDEKDININISDNYIFKKSISIQDISLDWMALDIGDSALNPSKINILPLNYNNIKYLNNTFTLKNNSINILLFKSIV